jgi:hypothetical protein
MADPSVLASAKHHHALGVVALSGTSAASGMSGQINASATPQPAASAVKRTSRRRTAQCSRPAVWLRN